VFLKNLVMRKLKNEELDRYTVEEFKALDKLPIVVVLDNIRSMNNIGSVFRTCDAFRMEAIYLCGITAAPPHKDIHKTALGATESVDWKYFEHTEEAIADLKNKGYKVVCIEQAEGSTKLSELSLVPSGKYGVVLGHEVRGVQQNIVDMCDEAIEIPQYGTKHSLNISVCAGIVVWEFFKAMGGVRKG
jgi:23S rRNA (guanosine2251-2'-O)-methyltransferase